MEIFFEFMRGRETSCSTNCFWAVETCVEIDLQIIHNGRWWWDDPLHFVEHRGGKNTLFVAMALLAYNNNLWIYIVWPVLIRYALQQYHNTKIKMLFHRKLSLIQFFFSPTWATSIFDFIWVLPFPVEMYVLWNIHQSNAW